MRTSQKALEEVNALIEGIDNYEEQTGEKNPPVYISKELLVKIQQALKRLEAIENANPSEALECLEEMWELSCDSRKPEYTLYETIKQTLLKQQEQEKVLKIVFEKNVDFDILTDSETLDDYNLKMNWSYRRLTQDEFDLLLKRWKECQKN